MNESEVDDKFPFVPFQQLSSPWPSGVSSMGSTEAIVQPSSMWFSPGSLDVSDTTSQCQ